MPTYDPAIGKKMRARARRRMAYLRLIGISEPTRRGIFGVDVHAHWNGIDIQWHAAYAYPVVSGSADMLLARPGDLRLLLQAGFKDYKYVE